MKNTKGSATLFIISIVALLPAYMHAKRQQPDYDYVQHYRQARNSVVVEDDYSKRYKGGKMIKEVFEDAFKIHKNLISWDTYKVFATTFPVFIATRIIDEDLQSHFYDRLHHKNKRKFPEWCDGVAEVSIAVPIILLGFQAFISKDDNLQSTSQVYLTGLPFVIFGKELIKKFRAKACLRPWHEKFDCEKRSGGGFPSGHLAEASYTAILFGMRFGPKFAIPLTLLTAFVGAVFVTCNRHYASQAIAGVGFGAMYALAANKVIEEKLSKRNVSFNVSPNAKGGTDFTVSCRF